MLGRMIALAGGDEGLARIVMPLLSDTLASQTSGADAEVRAMGRCLRLVHRSFFANSATQECFACELPYQQRLSLPCLQAYAVAAHSLASMAMCCAVHDRQWGYDHVRKPVVQLSSCIL